MPSAATTARYRFGAFELQAEERRLLASGEPVAIGPKALDLLVVLAQSGGRLVSKDELLEKVWPKVVVEENSLQAQVSALRKILGAEAIATVSRSGYRFTLDVTVLAAGSLPSWKHNLPQPLTSFIGREKELAELTQLLGTTRLLTLTGAGGCGKTRLAIRLGADLQGYTDGVWFVELAGLRDPALVPQAVANILGLQAKAGKTLTQAIAEHLASRRILLLLDNAEHLLDASAELVEAILERPAGAAILTTSREPLGIEGELTYRVPSLSVPDGQRDVTPEQLSAFESAQLLIERARLQKPHFVATVENASALASVCRRLDGIPLAIELAAPRLRSMSLEEIDRRLDHRFGLLTAGSHTALPRQRTLRSTIDWSFDLLTATEQALLCRLSVFAGGWELEAAESVCQGEGIDETEVLDLLESLVDKSLVSSEARAGVMRYRLLETVRQYARDRLLESDSGEHWQDRHLDFFAKLAERAEPHLQSADPTWLDRQEAEQDNTRAALAWTRSANERVSPGLRLAAAQWRFWLFRGYLTEGRRWLAELLVADRDAEPTAARGTALSGAGALAYVQGDFAGAEQHYRASLESRRQMGDHLGVAGALTNLASLARERVDFAAASTLYDEALVASRQAGDRLGVALATKGKGSMAILQEEFERARSFLEEALTLLDESGNSLGSAATFLDLADLAFAQRDLTLARDWVIKALRIYRDSRVRWGVAMSLNLLMMTAFARRDPGLAIRAYGAGLRLREEIDTPLPEKAQLYQKSGLDQARQAVGGDAEFDLALREGRSWDWEQAVEHVLSSEAASA